jgi:ketosteroid isomerase-like protein
LLGVIVALSMPAFAEDVDLKKQVEQITSAYMESYNKQDAAGIVAQYVPGAIMVTPAGARTDIAQYYDAAFKAGPNQLEIKTDQVWPLGPDAALGMGKFQVTGKDQSGAPAQLAGGLWTATYVREGGKLKIRMLTAFPPPPAK